MSLSSGRLEVGDRGCAIDTRRGGLPQPCVVERVRRNGRWAWVRFDDNKRSSLVAYEHFYFEAEAS